MLSGSEKYYDEIYSSMGKDYAAEADKIHEFIRKYKQSDGNTLLDVACGTGTHAGLLGKHYNVTGIDINSDMLKVARKKNPGIRFLLGDMRDTDLNRQFDVVTCLFSAIGYMRTKADLQKAVKSMSHSSKKGRISLLEFEYLIGTSRRIEHMAEHHEFGLFTHDEYMSAFKQAGLSVTHDPEGVDGRGLYIGLQAPNP